MKSLKDYLPKKTDLKLIQARIDPKVYDTINDLKRQNNLSWQELIEGLLRCYIDECKSKPKG